ncbi:hypothetical protein AAH979_06955 [Plantactinospora sp. ZYX-F-223]|uniref:hypothetical protein n=1 Tax=Plantactinospora sp. ZYX-F-223 TaxID=3144103 RepID=UPI0031FCBAB5
MTPLTPEGVSFSGRSRGQQDQPGPVYVRRADHVGVVGETARYADEFGLGDAVVPRAVPACGAGAGGVARIDPYGDTSGAFSLGVQYVEEHPQPASRIERFNPAFWATLRPGLSIVPFADRVMFLIGNASWAITS